MTLQELFNVIDHLSDEEVKALREYLEQRDREQWILAFGKAVQALQEGLSETDVAQIIEAVNAEYVEPTD
jgi:hypothetical protein